MEEWEDTAEAPRSTEVVTGFGFLSALEVMMRPYVDETVWERDKTPRGKDWGITRVELPLRKRKGPQQCIHN